MSLEEVAAHEVRMRVHMRPQCAHRVENMKYCEGFCAACTYLMRAEISHARARTSTAARSGVRTSIASTHTQDERSARTYVWKGLKYGYMQTLD